MINRIIIATLLLAATTATAQTKIDRRVDSVLRLMTLEEKVGQLNQYTADGLATGPVSGDDRKDEQLRQGKVGSMLNVKGVKDTRAVQTIALQSRLRIPLLFGQDVIHGYKTTFPIPLAEAASWDLPAIEKAARVAAVEAAASGIHWTFAPMVDIGRDPRWGRVMEGAGEDTYLGSLIAAARVKGFQGKRLGDIDAVMACVKHFAAYGAAIGGRDYNSVDMSDRMLWETYLPPFKAALDAGAATFMNSFNDLNGIPATANRYLQRDILKGKWKFSGFVVSDWGSIGEMIAHGYSADGAAAAKSAILAGSDMDMESRAYRDHLVTLVKKGEVPLSVVDDAVRRILRKKFEMGLFDDPFKFCNEEREQEALNNASHKAAARDMAKKSIVLLKNEKSLLPLSDTLKRIAFIGPLVKEVKQNLGFWSIEMPGDSSYIVSQWQGLRERLPANTQLAYAKGCGIADTSRGGFEEALRVAKTSQLVILSVGESRDMSGEAHSRASLQLPGVQEELMKAIHATGVPVVVVINAGRPLIFNWTADNMPAIVYSWWLGSEAGNALADVLTGDYNPSAKLPMTFPRAEGQIPIYYNHFNTGRPAASDSDRNYKSAYTDLPLSPRYAFGYGLSYTTFRYDNLQLDKKKMKAGEQISLQLKVTNTGKYAGEEVVQLYLRDRFGSVVRPVKELKDFRKISLQPGETKTVQFIINKEKLSFYNDKLQWIAEPGVFDVMIGSASDDIRLKEVIELM
ncbi:MAG: beta-glucosidase BglX [Terrimonas ferruginea]|uniref:beta-glucosidase BglX n=1 Tax=Terrimonas ferruginea TaxID=249 RepID=UPI000A9C415D|nr:beta-glucosidase BglX [Terrimonas ferruginea]MBN8784529.1 beta-glucosidase BglX [Terrimonas ferruginea]